MCKKTKSCVHAFSALFFKCFVNTDSTVLMAKRPFAQMQAVKIDPNTVNALLFCNGQRAQQGKLKQGWACK